MRYLVFLLLLGLVVTTSAEPQQRTQATIPALDKQSIDVYADSESFVTILEYFRTPAILNISHVQFQTASDTPTSSSSTNTTIPQYLHLVLMNLPSDCIKDDATKCDLHRLGIGLELIVGSGVIGGNNNNTTREWCCTLERQQQGHCQQVSQLIINQDIFQGQEHSMLVPQTIDTRFAIGPLGIFDIPQKGEYAFLLANCKETGLDLRSILLSSSQYAQLEFLEAFQDYYICLTFYHFLLFTAYIFAIMVISSDAQRLLSIQKWLGVTMAIAALDALFRCINYSSVVWDDVHQNWFNVFTVSITMGVLKRGISMCVGVMVAKGWGRVRGSLGGDLVVICMFGFLYTAIAFFHEISNARLETNLKNEIMVQGGDLTDKGLIFAAIILLMDVVFLVWMLMSVRSTILYIQSTGVGNQLQHQEQVSHHRVLGGLLTFSMLAMAPAWAIQFVDRFLTEPKILTNDEWSYMNAIVQGIYTLILTGVAALWIPRNSSSTMERNPENCTEMKELHSAENHNYNDNWGEEHEMHLWHEDNGVTCSDDPVFKDDANKDDLGNDPDYPNGLLVNSGQLS